MIVLTDDVRGCLAEIGEGLDDGLVLIDQQGTIQLSNRTARGLLELDADGVTLAGAGQWQVEVLELLRRLPTEGSATEVHMVGATPLVLEAHAVERNGGFWGGLIVARTAAATRNSAGATRATEFAHEVKSALHSLLLNLYMLRKWAASQPYVETQMLAKFDLVSNAIHRLNSLAEEFMPDPRAGLRRGSVRLSQVLPQVIGVFGPEARKARVQLRSRVPADLPAFPGDAGLLRDAFLALLRSRLAGMAEGGELEILAGVSEKHTFVLLTERTAGYTGRDTAAGDEYASRGVSRGIAMTEWIVRGHGGTIETFSTAGHSTSFLVKLPLPATVGTVADPDVGLINEA